jgi:CRISPR/Cas system CSM-associated protein Csm3 (group 7 of RAMP superfamily)
MEGINKRYEIELEVLTPLNIGAGAEKDWVKGADYVEKDGYAYKLNLRKMISSGIDINEISPLLETNNSKGIIKVIGGLLEKVTDSKYKLPLSTNNDIKSFIKNELTEKPIVPGSSIKGALRSILFNYLRDNDKDEKDVFGRSNEGDEFMRFIKLTDVDFNETQLVNTKIFNLQKNDQDWEGGWKHGANSTNEHYLPTGFNTIYEALMPRQKGYGSIMLSERLLELLNMPCLYKKERERLEKLPPSEKILKELRQIEHLVPKIGKKQELINNIDHLFSIVNNHTKRYLDKERNFFMNFNTENTKEIVESIDQLIKIIPDDNSFCIMKMSAGSGFNSITGDWQFDDYSSEPLNRKKDKKAKPKSRKIAIYGENNFSLMGFVKIRTLSEIEIICKQKEEEERALIRRKEREEYEQKKKEEEIRNAEILKRKSDYKLAITNAEELYSLNKLEDALAEFQNANNMDPEGTLHKDRIKAIEKELEKIHQDEVRDKFLEKVKKEEEENKKKKVENGLIILEEKYSLPPREGEYKVKDFKLAKSKIESWMKISGITQIPDDQIENLSKSLKRIFLGLTKDKDKKEWIHESQGVWLDIGKWIKDKDKVSALYQSVIL